MVGLSAKDWEDMVFVSHPEPLPSSQVMVAFAGVFCQSWGAPLMVRLGGVSSRAEMVIDGNVYVATGLLSRGSIMLISGVNV